MGCQEDGAGDLNPNHECVIGKERVADSQTERDSMWSQNLDTCQVMREETVWRMRSFQEVKELEEMGKIKGSCEDEGREQSPVSNVKSSIKELKELLKTLCYKREVQAWTQVSAKCR